MSEATEAGHGPADPAPGARTGDDVHFGEQGARLSYGSYLRLPDLLSAQVLQSDPPAHDELLFITIHQVYELWFTQLLHELSDARDRMLDGDAARPRLRLQRSHVITRLLVEQIDVLETMTPQDFLAFRNLLAPASGFQSVQFRELEFLSGSKDAGYLQRLDHATPAERIRLVARLEQPTLWDGLVHLIAVAGFPVDTVDRRRDALVTVSRDRSRYGALWEVAEALVEHDELWARWRMRHVLMVERQIGRKSGTGGSTGAPYLRSRLDLRYYPELWELRAHL